MRICQDVPAVSADPMVHEGSYGFEIDPSTDLVQHVLSKIPAECWQKLAGDSVVLKNEIHHYIMVDSRDISPASQGRTVHRREVVRYFANEKLRCVTPAEAVLAAAARDAITDHGTVVALVHDQNGSAFDVNMLNRGGALQLVSLLPVKIWQGRCWFIASTSSP